MGKIITNTMMAVLYQFFGICLLLFTVNVINVVAEVVAAADFLSVVSVIVMAVIAFVISIGFCCCCC